jgi:hypothetical protein
MLDNLLSVLLFLLAAGGVFVFFQAYRQFGTNQKVVYIHTFFDDKYIKAYMLDGNIYTRRYFFKLDLDSKLPFRYEHFPVVVEKNTLFGKVPVLKAVRTANGAIVPAYGRISDGTYEIIDYASKELRKIVQSELQSIAQLAAGYVTAPNSIMEAVIMGVKENWGIVMAALLGLSFLIVIGVGIKYNDALIAVSEKMKEVAEILREVSKEKLNYTNVTNMTDINVIVNATNK